MRVGKIQVRLSDIRQIDEDERFYYVACKISISGTMEYSSNDMFYIRKKCKGGNKISTITTYNEDSHN